MYVKRDEIRVMFTTRLVGLDESAEVIRAVSLLEKLDVDRHYLLVSDCLYIL